MTQHNQFFFWYIWMTFGQIFHLLVRMVHVSNTVLAVVVVLQCCSTENVLFSVLPVTEPAAADLRSNYFCYQSRSVRWLDKKLKEQHLTKKKDSKPRSPFSPNKRKKWKFDINQCGAEKMTMLLSSIHLFSPFFFSFYSSCENGILYFVWNAMDLRMFLFLWHAY